MPCSGLLPSSVRRHAVRLGAEAGGLALQETRCLVIGGGAIGLGSALALRANGATDITVSEANRRRIPAPQAAGFAIPVEYLSMSPYVITILVLVLMSARKGSAMGAPAALGRSFHATH